MLKKMINRYVELHRAMGFKYRIQSCLLQHFADFAHKKGDTYVRSNSVVEWAKQAPSRPQSRNRLLTVRRFAIMMQAEDKRYEIPPADAFGHATFNRRIIKILSENELKRILIAASKLKPINSIRPKTYATLFGVLAVTGLRISEALALNLEDIMNDGLIIRATKFRKNRIVPTHESTEKALQNYINFRNRYSSIDNALFISNHGKRLCYSTVNSIFLKLARSVGLRGAPGQSGVCIHDLRHRFAVRSLEQCKGDRTAVSQH